MWRPVEPHGPVPVAADPRHRDGQHGPGGDLQRGPRAAAHARVDCRAGQGASARQHGAEARQHEGHPAAQGVVVPADLSADRGTDGAATPQHSGGESRQGVGTCGG